VRALVHVSGADRPKKKRWAALDLHFAPSLRREKKHFGAAAPATLSGARPQPWSLRRAAPGSPVEARDVVTQPAPAAQWGTES